jgi:hypothetical protein
MREKGEGLRETAVKDLRLVIIKVARMSLLA